MSFRRSESVPSTCYSKRSFREIKGCRIAFPENSCLNETFSLLEALENMVLKASKGLI
jgi:hypothetical protein